MKVLIADDHPMVRDALARTMAAIDADVEVVEAANRSALETALSDPQVPDLVLVDLNMPGMQGVAGLQSLREQHPSVPVVVASAQEDPATIRAVLASGVSGFIPKSEPRELVLQAIRLVLAGGVYVPLRRMSSEAGPATLMPAVPNGDAAVLHGLTARQIDVLRLLMQGRPNKQIARELGLTEGTVKIHLAALLRGLQVRNRTEAVVRARQLGLMAEP